MSEKQINRGGITVDLNIRYQLPRINQYLYTKADKRKIPLGGTFELTPLCNMNCRMCYIRKSPDQLQERLMTAGEWLEIAREAGKQGLLFLLLTGGEPFLRADFKEIYLALHKMGFVLTINSNGTLITEKEVSWLRDAAPMRINLTVYGASNKTYETLCSNPRGYDQVMNAIHLLKASGIEVKLNYSLTPYNASDFYGIKKMAMEEGLFLQATTYMYPAIRKSMDNIGSNDRLPPEDAAYYTALSHYYEYGPKQFLEGTEEIRLADECVDEAVPTEKAGRREHIRCRAGVSTFWVTWNGIMTPCGMMNQPAENIREKGFEKAWEELCSNTRKILMPEECTDCAYKKRCSTCAAMVLAETGGYDEAPEYRCRMIKSYPEACRKLRGQIIRKELQEDVWRDESMD